MKLQSLATGLLKVNCNSATSFVFSTHYYNLFGKKKARKKFYFQVHNEKRKTSEDIHFFLLQPVYVSFPFLCPSLEFLFIPMCYEPSSSLSSHFRQQASSCNLRSTACSVCRDREAGRAVTLQPHGEPGRVS